MPLKSRSRTTPGDLNGLRNRGLSALVCLSLVALTACGTDADGAKNDAAQASTDGGVIDGGSGDVTAAHDGSQAQDGSADTSAKTPRMWRYRAIGGVSMGAASVNLALQHPELFDAAGGLGGYIDVRYMVAAGLRLQLGGFCPLDQLETALKQGVDLNDAKKAPQCGPAKPMYELEYPQSFNDLHFDDNGATFNRRFYRRVFQDLTMAFGSFTTGENPDSAFLPLGVSVTDHLARSPAERCKNPAPVAKAYAYNAEFNPKGAYPVIPFCDQEGGKDPKTFPGRFDPSKPSTHPWDILLAVDLNGNGKRDLAEPVIVNARERFDDVGLDGCPSPREDGKGGCLPASAPDATGDPNGDDFHWWKNPAGTEHDDWHNTDPKDPTRAEPYRDLGLDGVANTKDEGEGDGKYSISKAFDRARQVSAATATARLKAEQLKHLHLFLDSGIRDGLHAGVSTRRVVAALRARGEDVRYYREHSGRPDALLPDLKAADLIDKGFDADYSVAKLGKHVYVEYGKDNPTAADLAAGDGKHVGTAQQALYRIVTFMAWAINRFPEPDRAPTPDATLGVTFTRRIYSKSLKSWRNYVVTVPPGYQDAAKQGRRYPALYFLHGLGMDVTDLAPAGMLISSKMADGTMPKAILVFVDGNCCEVDQKTGAHLCDCVDDPDHKGHWLCTPPTCLGDEASCKPESIAKSQTQPECRDGSLYYNMYSDKWGKSRDDMLYADSVLDVIKAVDAHYRTRKPGVWP